MFVSIPPQVLDFNATKGTVKRGISFQKRWKRTNPRSPKTWGSPQAPFLKVSFSIKRCN